MANGGLLAGIMNPAQVDVLGSMDKGRERQATQMAGDILGQQIGGQIGALANLNPDMAIKIAELTNTPVNDKGRIDNLLGTNIAVAKLWDAGHQQEALGILQKQIEYTESQTGEEAKALRLAYNSLSAGGNDEVGQSFLAVGRKIDPTNQQPSTEEKPSEQRAFESLLDGLSESDKKKAVRVKLGLDERAVGSAIQNIAANGTAEVIAKTEETITKGKESGRQAAQLQFKPMIATAVTLATKAATARGETMTDLIRSEAALPGLIDAVSQLKDLAAVATSTLGGRAWDAVVKESGFGSTEGADGRAKFVAIINNQVLPLLKQTFGSAFTEKEGEALKATMGDPNATPSQKVLQVESFIDQKVRNIQASQRELEKEITPDGELTKPKFLGFE